MEKIQQDDTICKLDNSSKHNYEITFMNMKQRFLNYGITLTDRELILVEAAYAAGMSDAYERYREAIRKESSNLVNELCLDITDSVERAIRMAKGLNQGEEPKKILSQNTKITYIKGNNIPDGILKRFLS